MRSDEGVQEDSVGNATDRPLRGRRRAWGRCVEWDRAAALGRGPQDRFPDYQRQKARLPPAPGDYRGVHSLPPVGTSPSTPVQGELLIRLVAQPGTGFPGRFVPVHQVWVYSDGRAVWRREGGPDGDTGFLEQRLAPPGVELLQSEYLSTGLFDRHGYFLSEQGLSWGEMEARDGARLATVAWCCPPPESRLGSQPESATGPDCSANERSHPAQ